jgi:hypothetical protein
MSANIQGASKPEKKIHPWDRETPFDLTKTKGLQGQGAKGCGGTAGV